MTGRQACDWADGNVLKLVWSDGLQDLVNLKKNKTLNCILSKYQLYGMK